MGMYRTMLPDASGCADYIMYLRAVGLVGWSGDAIIP